MTVTEARRHRSGGRASGNHDGGHAAQALSCGGRSRGRELQALLFRLQPPPTRPVESCQRGRDLPREREAISLGSTRAGWGPLPLN